MPLKHPCKLLQLLQARDVAKGAFGERGGGIPLDCDRFGKVLLGALAVELAFWGKSAMSIGAWIRPF